MSDTGAPWNIPYVAGTDLVSDWPTDSQSLATAIADGLDAASIAIGSNVVQTVKSDTFSSSQVSGASVEVPTFSATITPTSASSKVLVHVDLHLHNGLEGGGNYVVERDGTPVALGDAASNRRRLTAQMLGVSAAVYVGNVPVTFLDSPATTSAVTYTVDIFNLGSTTRTLYVNRSADDSDSNLRPRTASRIILIEVAG